MSIAVIDNGKGNRVVIPDSVRLNGLWTITLNGDNNFVEIGEGCILRGFGLTFGSDCTLKIGKNGSLSALEIFGLNGLKLQIGDNATFTYHTRIMSHEGQSITIGNNCLFASGVLITASDMHSVIDVSTGHRINGPADIAIADHVWLGLDAWILKGSSVGRDSVIGARSVVSSEIPEQCVAVGVPARVVRTGVTWDHGLLPVG
ncbi:acetyltransferase-like isoleucine patch superfamily enzyme [Azospirillum sp. OGB3]|uniref:acyltransferase n=1 Tax=Azospirillum sp. OGB3 TaxID=2587012 RepID=UPI00160611A9|nr:acyltransferase [Azospirillum sp. OGB3]MBB3268231.1 acetyltransferase-like isoleucine patch superfamily enzyme [Azospirillum sp. OGB3]